MDEKGVVLIGKAAEAFVTFKYVELFTTTAFIVGFLLAIFLLGRWVYKHRDD